MPKPLDCTFAIIDIKRGRNALYKRMMDPATRPRIPVVIRGFITEVHSCDDGVSREFSLEVTSAEEQDVRCPDPWHGITECTDSSRCPRCGMKV